ncbi:unnamed protein product [Sphagnum jensenii]
MHPNYQDKHQESHQPKLHKGLVIKQNTNQCYATNPITSFLSRELGNMCAIPTQLWDSSTSQVLMEYEAHEKRAWSEDFSWADPTKLASGSGVLT